MPFQKGHKPYPTGEYAKQKKAKLAKFKNYIAKELRLDADNLIIDHLAAMMVSKDYKDRTKVVELLLKNLELSTGEPGAIDPEVLAVLAEFDNKRRKKTEKVDKEIG